MSTFKQLRINEQSALMNYIDNILPYYQQKYSNEPGFFTKVGREYVQHKNYATFRDTDADNNVFHDRSTTDIINKISSVTSRNGFIRDIVLRAPPDLLSLIVLDYKFYKTFISKEYEFDFLIPLNVGETWSLKQGRQLTEEEFNDEYKKLLGNTAEVYLKDFNFSYIGTNHAEANTMIDANLELLINTPDTLFEPIPVTADNCTQPHPADLSPYQFMFTDLIAASALTLKKENTYNCRIKVAISLNINLDPNNENHVNEFIAAIGGDESNMFTYLFTNKAITDPKEKLIEFKNSLSKMSTYLYISPYEHEIEIIGTNIIKFKIKYNGAIDQGLNNKESNIFLLYDKLQEIYAAEDQLQRDVIAYNQRSEEIKKENLTEEEKKRQFEFLEAYKPTQSLLLIDKAQMYQQVLVKLLNLSSVTKPDNTIEYTNAENSNSTKAIYTLKVPKESVGIASEVSSIAESANLYNLGKIDPKLKKIIDFDRIKPSSTIENRGENTNTSGGPTGASKFNNAALNTIKPSNSGNSLARYWTIGLSSNTDVGNIVANRDVAGNEKIAQQIYSNFTQDIATRIVIGDNYKNYTIKFIFLGDILDVIFDVLKNQKIIKQPISSTPRIILGDIKLTLPNGNPYYINIADIPISFEAFINFYTELVNKERPSTLTVFNFLRNLIDKLVKKALNPTFFGEAAGRANNEIQLGVHNFMYPYVNGNDIFTKKPSTENFNGIITSRDIENALSTRVDTTQLSNFGNYIIIYDATSPTPFWQKTDGDESKDADLGIYHFVPNTGTGILQKVVFQKQDAPYVRESLANLNGKSGGYLAELNQLYNVKLDTSPACFMYKPGDYIFIAPYFYNTANGVIASQKLGLGGYYLISTVSHNLDGITSKSVLDCKLVAWKKGNIWETGNK